jgi:ribose-phosphate pyrophosphokinase
MLQGKSLKIFSGRSNLPLVEEIISRFNISMGKVLCDNHPDGENKISVEENVRGCDIFIVQSTSPPVNDNIMELLIMIDAFRRASPRRITVVIPYYGYARQDRKHKPREPITAKLIADLLTAAGPDRILCFDLHSNQIEGFFDVPVDTLYPDEIFRNFLVEKEELTPENTIIASPDVGCLILSLMNDLLTSQEV